MTYKIPAILENATDEQKWNNIRAWRDIKLANSDWTQLPDSVADKAAWAIYRQALRDLPAQGGKAEDAEFPIAP